MITVIGFGYYAKVNKINHCKAAGWRFIDESIAWNPNSKGDISFKIYLIMKLAHFCKSDLTEHKKTYGL